ncbi:porin [uncultured Alistipes sp.]|uniref:porin n=1 Tax=uncultured Alistipes sp. TaxID=538949 RepID=UPI000E8C118D|nr:porin [uncultured Alistipes sp.]HBL70415.1 porin [Alistipes sp.]HBW01268.1 porin [Alistipes sp.]
MKKTTKMWALLLCGALIAPGLASANPEEKPAPAAETVTAEAPAVEKEKTGWEKFLEKLPKISGYLQSGWNYTSNANSSTSSFQAKRLRLLLDGKVGEKVDFRLQIEAFNGISGSTNGNGQKNLQVMDAFATWKIVPEFKVRVGQFYTPLGYENYDISPATLETVDFSNIVYRMACRNPYEYNLVDYGRDLGIMFIGDAFDSGKGFSYLHYDVAITNGSIPCKDDSNQSKDIYVSLTVRPFKYFNIKGTYNWGEYKSVELAGGKGVGSGSYNPMNRFVIGAWYDNPKGLNLRAEYGHMKSAVGGVDVVKENGAYVLAGWHLGKFLPIVRWDMYEDCVNTGTANNYNRILLGCTYQIFKNMKLQVNYGHFMYSGDAKDALGYDSSEQLQIMGMFKF